MYIFRLLPNNLHSIMYHENDVQSPIRTYLIIALHEHQAIFHVLQLYSTNQIPFFYIRCCSITCHFLVNNWHFITYSNCIVQSHWKKNSHGIKCYWYWVFHAVLLCLIFFYELKSVKATLDLTQLHVNSLWNNLHFVTYFTHAEGKVQISNNLSRSPLWNIILFLVQCILYSRLRYIFG